MNKSIIVSLAGLGAITVLSAGIALSLNKSTAPTDSSAATVSESNRQPNGNFQQQGNMPSNGGGRQQGRMQPTKGKVLSLTSNGFVIDATSSQSQVKFDAQTQVEKKESSSQDIVIKQGNYVSVSYTTENGVNKATSVTKTEAVVRPSGAPSGMPSGAAPSDFPQRNGDQVGMPGNRDQQQIGQPPTGTNSDATNMAHMIMGEIVSVSGNTITVKRGQESTETVTIDFSGASFFTNTKLTTADIKTGMTVSVDGQTANQIISARRITIE